MSRNDRGMNRIRSATVSCASLALCLACGSSGGADADAETGTEADTEASTGSPAAADVSTGGEVTSGPMDTTSTGSETTTSGVSSGSTGSTSESGDAESSGTTEDPGPTSCADMADVVNVWPGRAALAGELEDPILVPGSFSASSVVLALASSTFACADIGEYPCGQAGDVPPHEKLVIFLPEGQAAGTYEIGLPPQSDAPAVLEASTQGFPPFCSVGGSGYSWEAGVLELTSIDDMSIEGVFCRAPKNGVTQAWTFAVDRC